MPEIQFSLVVTIAGLHPESGGPSRSVPALCSALANQGARVEIVAHDYGAAQGRPNRPDNLDVHVSLVPCCSHLERRLQWTPRFKSALRSRCDTLRPKLIHDTGIWLSTNRAAAAVASRLQLPRVVSPRGMLSGWALRHKGMKKRLAWFSYQKRDLQSAALLHATSAAEAQELRAAGLSSPVAVIPNGVELPPVSSLPRGATSTDGPRTVLFLSRIHPVKGLLNLVQAWSQLQPRGWRVVVAGHDEMNHTAQVRDAVCAAGVGRDFQFIGPVAASDRWSCYQQADLFILPSHSENFGIVIAEALACGVPVITTTGTPWAGLVAHRSGWWVDVGVEPLRIALHEALSLSPEVLQQMGQRGREWMEHDFSWQGVARQMIDVYRWLLGENQKPTCVLG